MTKEELIEYSQNEIWQFNLKIGLCILALAILSNYVPYLEVIFTPNVANFVQGGLYGIGLCYELISMYNINHKSTLKEKKKQTINKKIKQ